MSRFSDVLRLFLLMLNIAGVLFCVILTSFGFDGMLIDGSPDENRALAIQATAFLVLAALNLAVLHKGGREKMLYLRTIAIAANILMMLCLGYLVSRGGAIESTFLVACVLNATGLWFLNQSCNSSDSSSVAR